MQNQQDPIFSKLLGFYEKELQKVIKNLIKRDCEIAVDVGCAEGYYTVGLARVFKDKETKVLAYDINKKANLEIMKCS